MSSKDTGGSAFPFGQVSELTGQPINGFFEPGMSLRDYFAAKAMQALYTSMYEYELTGKPQTQEDQEKMLELARGAYDLADAMLKARGA